MSTRSARPQAKTPPLIVLNTPNNPTGAVYDLDAVREVVAVADAVDALVMVDEVYDHFDLTGEFESALMLDSDRVIVTSGFSKSMAITGFRVGYGSSPRASATPRRGTCS